MVRQEDARAGEVTDLSDRIDLVGLWGSAAFEDHAADASDDSWEEEEMVRAAIARADAMEDDAAVRAHVAAQAAAQAREAVHE